MALLNELARLSLRSSLLANFRTGDGTPNVSLTGETSHRIRRRPDIIGRKVLPQSFAAVYNFSVFPGADLIPARVPQSVPHLCSETIEVRGGWLSFVATGEQTGGAYALIETANNSSTGVRLHVHE